MDPIPERQSAAPAIDLDHVSLAVAAAMPPLRRLVGELGATVYHGGALPGCRYVVARLGDADRGMNLELIEPHEVSEDEFLVRFLRRRDEGPNHITFLVEELDPLLARFAEAGLRPVKARLDDPVWREAFFDPADAGGTVLQLGESTLDLTPKHLFEVARREEARRAEAIDSLGMPPGTPGWWEWPGPRSGPQVVLERVVLAVSDLESARRLYADLLGGEVVEDGDGALELRWPGGGRLRFEHAPRARPGVIRLDCSGLPDRGLELGGARFAPLAGRVPG